MYSQCAAEIALFYSRFAIPLSAGDTYRSDRGLIWVVYWYVSMYYVSVCSVWLSTVWYMPYRQLVGTSVPTGKANHILLSSISIFFYLKMFVAFKRIHYICLMICFLHKQGKMSCLMINDIDAGLGRFGQSFICFCLWIWSVHNIKLDEGILFISYDVQNVLF